MPILSRKTKTEKIRELESKILSAHQMAAYYDMQARRINIEIEKDKKLLEFLKSEEG